MTKASDIYSGLGAEAGPSEKRASPSDLLFPASQEGEEEEEERGEVAGVESISTKKTVAAALSEEEEIAKVIQRAETITHSLANAKVFALVGQPDKVLDKPMYLHSFDAAFVSARSAACIQHAWFANLLKPKYGT